MATATVEKSANLQQLNCPRCQSNRIIKNGRDRHKARQRYKCKDCNRHFLEYYIQHNQSVSTRTKVQIPDRVLMLLTSHRSGSTWLSDAIRCHPNIEYYPSWILYEKLNFSGGRYPKDLSGLADGTYKIEIQPNQWNKIPQFNLLQDLTPSLQQVKFEPYAIEKCHPSFFDFNFDRFLTGIKNLENLNVSVQLVYVVREPKSLITSFMDYQQRNTAWYKSIVGGKIIDLITKTFKSIKQVSEQKPSLILDYSDTKTDMARVLLKIYKMLWSKNNSVEQECLINISKLALKYTERKSRLSKTNSPFLGQQEGTTSGGNERYQDFFATHEELMDKCYFWYHQIIPKSKN